MEPITLTELQEDSLTENVRIESSPEKVMVGLVCPYLGGREYAQPQYDQVIGVLKWFINEKGFDLDLLAKGFNPQRVNGLTLKVESELSEVIATITYHNPNDFDMNTFKKLSRVDYD